MNSNFEASQASLDMMENEYALDGKCPAFESDRDLFFSASMISAYFLSAYSSNFGSFEGTIICMLTSWSHKMLKVSE